MWICFAAFVLLMGIGIAVAVLLNVRISGVGEARSDEERILHVARYIARTYDNRPPGAAYYGILYSRRLPVVVRLPTGVLKTLTHPRDYDSMVRALVYLAAREGIEARQSDIFAPTFVHSVGEVRLDDRWYWSTPTSMSCFADRIGPSPDSIRSRQTMRR